MLTSRLFFGEHGESVPQVVARLAGLLVVIALLAACPAGLPVDDPADGETTGGGGTTVAGVDTLQAGDLVITEVMQDPGAVADGAGEWFEVYVAASEEVDLLGLVVEDDGSDSFTVGSSLVAQPGSYVVFGNSDSASNGGVTVDYVYTYTEMSLINSGDKIILKNGSVIVDEVAYDGGPGFPNQAGASMQLDPELRNHTDNDVGANWCASTTSWSAGSDLGTPGAANGECL